MCKWCRSMMEMVKIGANYLSVGSQEFWVPWELHYTTTSKHMLLTPPILICYYCYLIGKLSPSHFHWHLHINTEKCTYRHLLSSLVLGPCISVLTQRYSYWLSRWTFPTKFTFTCSKTCLLQCKNTKVTLWTPWCDKRRSIFNSANLGMLKTCIWPASIPTVYVCLDTHYDVCNTLTFEHCGSGPLQVWHIQASL